MSTRAERIDVIFGVLATFDLDDALELATEVNEALEPLLFDDDAEARRPDGMAAGIVAVVLLAIFAMPFVAGAVALTVWLWP